MQIETYIKNMKQRGQCTYAILLAVKYESIDKYGDMFLINYSQKILVIINSICTDI